MNWSGGAKVKHRTLKTLVLAAALCCLFSAMIIPSSAFTMKELIQSLSSLISPAATDDGGSSSALIPYGEFTNKSNDTPDLYVRKTVKSSVDGAEPPADEIFHFAIKVGGSFLNEYEYELYDQDGKQIVQYYKTGEGTYFESTEEQTDQQYVVSPWLTTRSGEFTLKAGQTARFADLGADASFEVFEENLPANFVQTEPPGKASQSGNIAPKGSSAEFVNTWYPETEMELAELQIAKRVLMPTGFQLPETPEFTFELTVRNAPYSDQLYSVRNSEDGTPVLKEDGGELTGLTDSSGRFKLRGGQMAVFEDVETQVDYSVKEILEGAGSGSEGSEGWHQTGVTGESGAVTGPVTRVEFTNATSAFAVSKQTENGLGTGVQFEFQLLNGDNEPWQSASYYLYDADGQLLLDGAQQSTDAEGKFRLEAGQTALFTGIDPGVQYTVKELPVDGWEQTSPTDGGSFTGTVSDRSLPVHTFVNRKETTASIIIRKTDSTVEGSPLADVSFLLKAGSGSETATVAVLDETDDSTWKFREWVTQDQGGTEMKTGTDGTLTITGLELGTYTLCETAPLKGYEAVEDITFVLQPSVGSGENSEEEQTELLLAAGDSGREDAAVSGSVQDGDATLTVVNIREQAVLPTTGGAGAVRTAVLFLTGFLVSAAAVYAVRQRRQEHRLV